MPVDPTGSFARTAGRPAARNSATSVSDTALATDAADALLVFGGGVAFQDTLGPRTDAAVELDAIRGDREIVDHHDVGLRQLGASIGLGGFDVARRAGDQGERRDRDDAEDGDPRPFRSRMGFLPLIVRPWAVRRRLCQAK